MSFENQNMYKRGREYKRREAGKANLLRVAAGCGFLAVAISLFMVAANYVDTQYQRQNLINSLQEKGPHTVLFDCVVFAINVQSMPDPNADSLGRSAIFYDPLLIQTKNGAWIAATSYDLGGQFFFVPDDSPDIRKNGPCSPAQATITRYEDRNLFIAKIMTPNGLTSEVGIARVTLNENK